MFWFYQTDETDPIGRSYRHYFHMLCIWGVIFLVLAGVVLAVGVPHFQLTTYTYYGHKRSDGITPASQKIDAWYLSVTGWKHIRSGQYGHNGCPFILFVPLRDCWPTAK